MGITPCFKNEILRELGSCNSLHAWHANKAEFNSLMSWKPRPPINIGLDIVLQETSEFSSRPFYFLTKTFKEAHQCAHKVPEEVWNAHKKVGMDWATDLMSTSFPPTDKHFSINPCTCFQILSLRYLNHPSLNLPTSVSNPKYLSDKDSFCTARIFLTSFQRVLSTVILCLETSQYFFRRS